MIYDQKFSLVKLEWKPTSNLHIVGKYRKLHWFDFKAEKALVFAIVEVVGVCEDDIFALKLYLVVVLAPKCERSIFNFPSFASFNLKNQHIRQETRVNLSAAYEDLSGVNSAD